MTRKYLDHEIVDELETRTSRRLEAHIQDMRYRTDHRIRILTFFAIPVLLLGFLSVIVFGYLNTRALNNLDIISKGAISTVEEVTTVARNAANLNLKRTDETVRDAKTAAGSARAAADQLLPILSEVSDVISGAESVTSKANEATQKALAAAQRANNAADAAEKTEQMISEIRENLEEELRRVQSNNSLMER